MSFGSCNESGVAFISPRVLAVLTWSSPPGGTTVLPEHPLAVLTWSSPPGGTTVLPEHPLEVLNRSSSLDETAVLSEHELDWLQSGVVYPPACASKKGRSVVSWRQARRRERRAARKYGVGTSPPRCQWATTRPRTFSGVSGQLTQGRSRRPPQFSSRVPTTSPPTNPLVVGLAVPPAVSSPIGCSVNLKIEKRFMRRYAVRTRPRESGCPVRPR